MRTRSGSLLLAIVLLAAPSVPPDARGAAGAPHSRSEAGPVERSIDRAFSREDLRADFLQVRRVLEETHPAVYGFTPKADFERLADELLGRIDGPKTAAEFFRLAAPLVAAVGCGHTRLWLPGNYGEDAPPRFFPLRLRFVGGRAYVVGSPEAAAGLEPGSEILAISGRSLADIFAELKVLVSSDGFNDGARTAFISRTFPLLCSVQFGFPDAYVVEARPAGGPKPVTVRLPTVALASLSAARGSGSGPTSSGDPNLDLRILPGKPPAAVLMIRSFSYYQQVVKFKRFIDESFDRINRAGVRHLILDLRGNGGGDPFCSTHLLSYLEPKAVPYFARFYPGYERFALPIPRAGGAFDGRLLTLIDAGCFSSTGHFCALLKFHKIGTFIGAETGATYECNDNSREVVLERTRLRLNCARTTYTVAVQGLPRYRGIIPDTVVEPDIADIIAGRDPVMDRALSLIAEDGSI